MSDTPTPAPQPSTVSNFLELHGTVLLLYSLVLVFFGATFYLGLKLHADGEKLLAFFEGAAAGAFSTLALGMKVASK